jgi:N-acetylglutamate synthase-like GNAT family acetyltransferase
MAHPLVDAYLKMTQSKEEPYYCYVALENGKVIGVLCFRKVKEAVYLRRIGIKEGYQTIGNGYYLHKFLMDFVEKEKVKVIFAEAHYGVFRWFEDLGYHKIREYNDANWGKSAYMLLLIG